MDTCEWTDHDISYCNSTKNSILGYDLPKELLRSKQWLPI